MLRTAAVLAMSVLCLSQQPAATDLGALFRAAAQDPAQIVPLILEVSEALPKLDGDTGQMLSDQLEPYCKQAFFSPTSIPGIERLGVIEHEVRAGELPGAIARRYGIGSGMLALLNAKYDERRIHVGDKLRVLDLSNGSLQLIVDTRRFRLAAWHKTPEGRFVLSMYVTVGLGAPATPTPTGTTRITDRVRNPPWTDPATRQTYPHGDPRNVLGGYWIRLAEEGIGVTGIGLHGYTGAPAIDWMSKGSSNGCVRMLQPDIARVFELALEGTKVVLAP